MILDFNDFLRHMEERSTEATYDIVSKFQNAYNENLTLSQADISLITSIAIQSNYAILRQYHQWMTEQLK